MIARAPFGRTGHSSSRTIFGAGALARASQREADDALELLLAHGVNHLDTAASYGDSELRIAPWLRRAPGEFFLATKTGQRERRAAGEEIRRSLERLGVDRVDLLQLHNLVDPVDWEVALGPGGALEAALEARDEGLVRFLGVTGHGVSVAAMHLRSLELHPFDSVLLPCNWITLQDARYREHFDALLATCAERGVAVQTIKSLARRPWAGREWQAATWYEPLRDPRDVELAVHWVLGRPEGVFLNTAGDLELLPLVLGAADRFSGPPAEDALAELAERAAFVPLFV